MPFLYESTGLETHFTNALDPEPRARTVFAFHRPETVAEWLAAIPQAKVLSTGAGAPSGVIPGEESGSNLFPRHRAELSPATFLARVRHLPPLATE